MPRRTADERHADSAPSREGPELIEQLIAYHHPTRQRILECLALHGPAPVGVLADLLDLAPGSVSHHLKPLHRAGFVEPAPELAADTRASWWRSSQTSVAYDADDFPAGSRAREVVSLAEKANDDRHVAAIRSWREGRSSLPAAWRRAGGSQDSTTAATPAQVQDLLERVQALMREWGEECRQDTEDHPDADRLPVLFFAHAGPSPSWTSR